MIIFENIDNGDTFGISREREGKHYRAKLSALMNSSNMSPNADRGQDFGLRLVPEQQALIEQWESDPQMIDKVSTWSKVMLDDLTHSEFLAYLLYQQELGTSPEIANDADRRSNQRGYEARVEALRAGKPVAMPVFDPGIARGEATVEDFLNGDVTGDASGDKAEEAIELPPNSLDELDKAIAETGNQPPVIENPVVGESKASTKKSAKK